MRGAAFLPAVLALAGCVSAPAYQRIEVGSASAAVDGELYRVVLVKNEPTGHVRARMAGGKLPPLDAGPYEPAVRIEGVASGDNDKALRAYAQVCGHPYAMVRDWGAYGDPIWKDPRDRAVVLFTGDCPALAGG